MKRRMFRCTCCGRYLPCDPRSRNQRYCGRRQCQQARKNRWQRHKLANDPDYRADKRDSQRAWQQKNKDYWKKYRRKHPVYAQKNRQQQKERDLSRPSPVPHQLMAAQPADLAKKDSLNAFLDDNSGGYFILPADASLLAKKDALMVKIIPISTG